MVLKAAKGLNGKPGESIYTLLEHSLAGGLHCIPMKETRQKSQFDHLVGELITEIDFKYFCSRPNFNGTYNYVNVISSMMM